MDQEIQQTPQQPAPTIEHSHTGMYLAVGLSLAAVAGLLFVVLILPKYQVTSKIQPAAELQTQSTTQNEVQQVSPLPITNKQNLDSATQTLDTTDVTQIDAGIDQNTQDTSSFK